jgi:hypothetical protein
VPQAADTGWRFSINIPDARPAGLGVNDHEEFQVGIRAIGVGGLDFNLITAFITAGLGVSMVDSELAAGFAADDTAFTVSPIDI